MCHHVVMGDTFTFETQSQIYLRYWNNTARCPRDVDRTSARYHVRSPKSHCTMTSRYTEELSWRIGRIPFEAEKEGAQEEGGKKNLKKNEKKWKKVGEEGEEDDPYLRPKRRTPLRFDQIQEGPQDPFCANAQGNVEVDHETMERRRIYVGNVQSTKRGRIEFWTDDRNVFWLRYRGTARDGREEEEKKERNRAGAYL